MKLSDLLAIPVMSGSVSMNFPTNHPMNLTGDSEVLSAADVVLGLEVRDLFGALNTLEPGTGHVVPRLSTAR